MAEADSFDWAADRPLPTGITALQRPTGCRESCRVRKNVLRASEAKARVDYADFCGKHSK